jgi:hypothetical protein
MTHHRTAMLAVLLLVSGACGLISEPEPESVPADEILRAYRVGTTALPVRSGRDTIVAELPRRASKKLVAFTVDRGTFAPVPGARTIAVRAEPVDGVLRATALLQADTVPGTVVVTVSVDEHIRYVQVPLAAP